MEMGEFCHAVLKQGGGLSIVGAVALNFFKIMLKRYYDAKRYYTNSYNIFDLKSLHLKT